MAESVGYSIFLFLLAIFIIVVCSANIYYYNQIRNTSQINYPEGVTPSSGVNPEAATLVLTFGITGLNFAKGDTVNVTLNNSFKAKSSFKGIIDVYDPATKTMTLTNLNSFSGNGWSSTTSQPIILSHMNAAEGISNNQAIGGLIVNGLLLTMALIILVWRITKFFNKDVNIEFDYLTGEYEGKAGKATVAAGKAFARKTGAGFRKLGDVISNWGSDAAASVAPAVVSGAISPTTAASAAASGASTTATVSGATPVQAGAAAAAGAAASSASTTAISAGATPVQAAAISEAAAASAAASVAAGATPVQAAADGATSALSDAGVSQSQVAAAAGVAAAGVAAATGPQVGAGTGLIFTSEERQAAAARQAAARQVATQARDEEDIDPVLEAAYNAGVSQAQRDAVPNSPTSRSLTAARRYSPTINTDANRIIAARRAAAARRIAATLD